MSNNDFIINQLQSDLSFLNTQLADNQEKLIRLKLAKRDIEANQEIYFANKRLVEEPQLTVDVWSGRHANVFLGIRSTIEDSYNKVGNEGIEGLLHGIEEKISYFEAENQQVMNSISSKRENISQLINS
ncbi:DUF5082 domain-containing protein [Rossellomorea vietnamensis]|uniref:DUF5082 domain-containing protein n=1 Tax=Rossellomorea vietnamensis TaxID=218284 RepID=A0ACD4C3A0_9BACI|nr:DUF5082 domain-containing protein [Rossellomorea vietnamensis]UXH42988.1 DUF5082 domain-containing protein [Rossellomorea vietnamensis]